MQAVRWEGLQDPSSHLPHFKSPRALPSTPSGYSELSDGNVGAGCVAEYGGGPSREGAGQSSWLSPHGHQYPAGRGCPMSLAKGCKIHQSTF